MHLYVYIYIYVITCVTIVLLLFMLALEPYVYYELMKHYPVFSRAILQILPSYHQQTIWNPDFMVHGTGLLILFSIGCSYLMLGYQIFLRREK